MKQEQLDKITPRIREALVYLRNSRMRIHAIELCHRITGATLADCHKYVANATAPMPIISLEHMVALGRVGTPAPPPGYVHHPTLEEPEGPNYCTPEGGS